MKFSWRAARIAGSILVVGWAAIPLSAHPNRRSPIEAGTSTGEVGELGKFFQKVNPFNEEPVKTHYLAKQPVTHVEVEELPAFVPANFTGHVVRVVPSRVPVPPAEVPTLASFMARLKADQESIQSGMDPDTTEDAEGSLEALSALAASELNSANSPLNDLTASLNANTAFEEELYIEREAIFPRPHIVQPARERLLLFFPVKPPSSASETDSILVPVELPAARFTPPGASGLRSSATIRQVP